MIHQFSSTEVERMRLEFLRIIESGIVACGVAVQRRRPGFKLDLDGRDIRVWLTYYRDHRWWRLVCGYGSERPGFEQTIVRTHELTMLAGEIDENTGRHVVDLLRNPQGYQWPLFAWDDTYPSYAWSRAGSESIEAAQREDRERDDRRAALLTAKGAR